MSPAELAKLEHAFAADPSSDAYQPLAEAYLGMGRFMEAMVVCKKGVKAHPELAAPRVLLARVYAEQGKEKKALEEVLGALQSQPGDVVALRMAATLQFKTGEAEAAKANLLKAYEANRADAETLALMQQHGVQSAAPAPVAPAPVTAPAPAPVAAAPAPVASQPAPAPAPAAPAKKAEPASRPAVARASEDEDEAPARPVRRAPVVVEEVEEDDEEDDEPRSRRKPAKSGSGKFVTLGLVIAVVGLGGGYGGYSSWSRGRNREVAKNLKVVSEQLKHDSFTAYEEATKAGDAALEVHSDSGIAHAYQSYAYAIRFGEHGGGDDARAKAEEHLAAAKKNGDTSQHSTAAEALLKMYTGKAKEAVAPLEERIKALEAEDKPRQLLYLTLGLVQMNLGDLEKSRDNLEKAQTAAEARVYAGLGAVYRRLGQNDKADQSYEVALRYEKDHPESLLGRSLVMLEAGDSRFFEPVATMVQKLLATGSPVSPRQLAAAHLARSLLLSRVAATTDLKDEVKKKLEGLGLPTEKEKARAEMLKAEDAGFGLDKQNPELFLLKGRRLLLEGQPDAAAEEIRRAVKMDGSRVYFHAELARALLAKPGGEQAAVDALTSALKAAGDSPVLVVMLGDAYRKQGKQDEALAQYQRVAKDPKAKVPEAHLGIGIIHRERSEWDKAVTALARAGQDFVGQKERAVLAFTELGRVYQSKGDATKADEAYLRAINSSERYAPAFYFYASFQGKERKDSAKAKLLAQRYLELEPKGEYAADAQRLASAE